MTALPGTLILALRHARYHASRSAIIAACIAVAIALPLTVRALVSTFESALTARAASTPLLIGARGNRFDLAMAILYFRRGELTTISMADLRAVSEAGGSGGSGGGGGGGGGGGTFIPINARFTARNIPIVAAPPEYHAARNLSPAQGTLPLMLGDVAIGARAATALNLRPGDHLFSDQRELFDIAKPQALKMRVSGILAPTHTPDDDALFVDLKTAWILEGLSHAHTDPAKADPALVLARTDTSVALSEELIDYNEVTEANAAAFHLHAEERQLPLTGILVLPDSPKSATIIHSRINTSRLLQSVIPTDVVRDLLAYVLRLQALLDGLAFLIAAITAVFIALVTALAVRVRARELVTLRKIGVAPRAVFALFAWEIAALALLGALAGLTLATLAARLTPDLIRFL